MIRRKREEVVVLLFIQCPQLMGSDNSSHINTVSDGYLNLALTSQVDHTTSGLCMCFHQQHSE